MRREALQLAEAIAQEKSNFEIAKDTGLDVNTVGQRVAALYQDLALPRNLKGKRRILVGAAYKVFSAKRGKGETKQAKDQEMPSSPAIVKAKSAEEVSVGEYAYLDLLGRVKKALGTAQEITIPVSDIRPYIGQPREYFDPDSIRRLSASIDAGGQTSSGMVRKKPAKISCEVIDTGREIEVHARTGLTNYELIDGERRWRSINLIPEHRRPLYRAKLIVADDDVVQYLISGITNFNREGHTPIETMRTIEAHINFGFPMEEIAILLGLSKFWAEQIYGLRKLDPKVLQLLDPKLPKPQQLPLTAGIQIAKADPSLQQGLADRVIKRDITMGRLRGEVIRVAEAAGMPVQTRMIGPSKQWESIRTGMRVGMENAQLLRDKLKDPKMARVIVERARNSHEVGALIFQLEETIKASNESLNLLASTPRKTS